MYLTWENGTPLADREMLAALYEVSPRTIRRHCRPVRYEPASGRQRGKNGLALYDALAAEAALEGVAPRPGRAAAGLRLRREGRQAR